ncbi:hypothetical protein [Magnetospirillum sp. UT-4]|uniref:hypothetical protein n=1 Tax=Magnetospirillum sp. UT-4 TaxID=2681467 RepID=UPI001381A450|nr:hypothetical protein [Magnetospirillum sp. UT-4]CAA7613239.1 conserved hypothetical protein [Magnetospirillum sp. UT-4]
MADDTRISATGARPAGLDIIRQALGGLGTPDTAGSARHAPHRGAIGGPPGQRVLPADFPLDQLDRNARRGTYLDILI